MDEGVPGIFSRIAEIRPPEVAPMNSATSSDRPACGPMVKVSGRHRATAMVADRPGTAPKTIPMATPTAISIMMFSEKTAPKPCCSKSSMVDPQMKLFSRPAGNIRSKASRNSRKMTAEQITEITR